MFPQTDEISNIISDTVKVVCKRRLVDRVLRHWAEMAREQRFPRREQIEPSTLGADWAHCFLIAVQSPVELSHFVGVGKTYHLRAVLTIVSQACSFHICRRF